MRCSNCGTDNTARAWFCDQCATSLRKRCPKCTSQNGPDARFCSHCAASLEPAAPVRAEAKPRDGLRRFALACWAAFRALGKSFVRESRASLRQWTAFRLALAVAIVVVASLVIQEIFSDQTVIDVVNVPKTFVDEGYMSEVVARQIVDEINEIRKSVQIAERQTRVAFIALPGDSPLPNFEVPEAGVSLQTVVRFVQQALHVGPDHIVVDVMLDSASASVDAARNAGKDRLEIAVGRSPSGERGPIREEIFTRHPQDVMDSVARDTLEEADPNTLGLYFDNQRMYELAIKVYQAAIELDPKKSADSYTGWGWVLYEKGNYPGAIAMYKKAINIEPRSSHAYSNWGVALYDQGMYKQGMYKQAIAQFQKAIEFNANNAYAYNNWGNALDDQGDHKDAIDKYQKATAVDPEYAIAFFNWGGALYGLGKYDQAIEKYRQANDLDPKSAYPYYGWGEALCAQGKYGEAITKLKKATDINSEFPLAYQNWALALNKMGEHCEAQSKSAIAAGVALYGEGKYEEAIAKYQKAIDLDPKYANVYNNIGDALYRQGKYEKAISNYKRATDLDPRSVLGYENQALALDEMGNHGEAEAQRATAAKIRIEAQYQASP